MQIYLNETQVKQNLYPFAQIRHVADIRVGILTIKQKWELITGCKVYTNAALFNEATKNVSENEKMIFAANLIPTTSWWNKIKEHLNTLNNGDFAVEGNSDLVKELHYPWHIFQYNDWALRQDFDLITQGKTSAPISSTNTIINASQIFLEAGAMVEYCSLNASTGPIYIGKNAQIQEGSMIRGAFAMCEGGLVKMGAKIYGATTLGPYCLAGGEIKNSVIMGYSNKAHDGYLGDSVIGEWCNLGAGTSNSNLKNNCGDVSYWVQAQNKKISAGNKGGLLLGDYSKSSINTSFNTGTVVGICSNVFAPGLTPKYIPNFSWGCDGNTQYLLSKALDDIDKWKQLKGFSITETEKEILTDIYKNLKK
jgi:UDP-N-acetylglucosamine diphosphorylase / glucose-1-phosphate thymidylyltransferase / UDP-N-acetylgalactosamine diphosphorylase / glucosamine-1-phosphate N-acetyltransferase / galactosamine-1-phosphate N-acetyltransferase